MKFDEIYTLLFEKKDHLIKKMVNLSDEEKQTLIDFFQKRPNLESHPSIHNIWNKPQEATFDDFKEVMKPKEEKRKEKAEVALGELKEGKDYLQFKTGKPNVTAFIPIHWEASKFIASNKVANQEGKWCTAYEQSSQHWEEYVYKDKHILIYLVNFENRDKFAIRMDREYYFIELRNKGGKDDLTEKSFLKESGVNPRKLVDENKDIIDEGFKIIDNSDEYIGYEKSEEFAEEIEKENPDFEKIKELLKDKRVDPSVEKNSAIRYASSVGYFEIVKLLLKDERVNPSDENNQAIRVASVNKHFKIVKLLLKDKRVDPSVENNLVIQLASHNGQLEVVELLLNDERVDPSDKDNRAIRWASRNVHEKIVNLLKKHPKVIQKAKELGQDLEKF